MPNRRFDRVLPSLRALLPDLLGFSIAGAYGLPSLWYAFGRDQAIFFYIGREWLNGTVPYRDAFDLKPPAIFLLHALSTALLGPYVWTIRFVELAAVLGMGALAAHAVQRDAPRARGELGLAAMLASGFYYTTFDYWDTGQVEIWEGLCLLAAYVAILRGRRLLSSALLGGVLAGLAITFKFTAGIVSVMLALPVAVRAYRDVDEGARAERAKRVGAALGMFGLGGLLPIAGFVGYFAALGALDALVELMGYIRTYANAAWNPPDPLEPYRWQWHRVAVWSVAFGFAWLIAVGEAARRRALGVLAGGAFALALFVGALATVAVQRKYFSYHWAVTTPFLVLLGAYGVAECSRLSVTIPRWSVLGLLLAGFLIAPPWPANLAVNYRLYVLDHWREYVRGRAPREALSSVFTGVAAYSWANQEAIARTIRARARPGDRLHVRGFELGLYALTGLRTTARFVSEIPLDDATLAYKQDAWRAQHEHAIWSARPRFVVGFWDRRADVEQILARGYRKVQRAGLFLLMERNE